MSPRRASSIPQRRPVFIGCEGQSEVSYANFLLDLVNEAGVPVHLEVSDLGGGDPLSRIEKAIRRLEHLNRTRTALKERFALLDYDQVERDPQRADQAARKAADHNITIVWQRPCFEAMLLRHLPRCEASRPSDTLIAESRLRDQWPDYVKPMSRNKLAHRLDIECVRRAAKVEPELAILLQCIGLIEQTR
jgi:hypothetical protein